ncbi:hypothetical protein R4J18_10250 [Brachyspira pilosicoli]|uniref:hypothetical protein n=1 Tax=Brachyspira pilosicoli TaxID=52584 RepID=UPI0030065F5F
MARKNKKIDKFILEEKRMKYDLLSKLINQMWVIPVIIFVAKTDIKPEHISGFSNILSSLGNDKIYVFIIFILIIIIIFLYNDNRKIRNNDIYISNRIANMMKGNDNESR